MALRLDSSTALPGPYVPNEEPSSVNYIDPVTDLNTIRLKIGTIWMKFELLFNELHKSRVTCITDRISEVSRVRNVDERKYQIDFLLLVLQSLEQINSLMRCSAAKMKTFVNNLVVGLTAMAGNLKIPTSQFPQPYEGLTKQFDLSAKMVQTVCDQKMWLLEMGMFADPDDNFTEFVYAEHKQYLKDIMDLFEDYLRSMVEVAGLLEGFRFAYLNEKRRQLNPLLSIIAMIFCSVTIGQFCPIPQIQAIGWTGCAFGGMWMMKHMVDRIYDYAELGPSQCTSCVKRFKRD